jgi:hypothetical protein
LKQYINRTLFSLRSTGTKSINLRNNTPISQTKQTRNIAAEQKEHSVSANEYQIKTKK